MVQDLDSSTGTFLNSSKILSLHSCPLHHGDVIKLGEETSILVQFKSPGKPLQLRCNPGRKVWNRWWSQLKSSSSSSLSSSSRESICPCYFSSSCSLNVNPVSELFNHDKEEEEAAAYSRKAATLSRTFVNARIEQGFLFFSFYLLMFLLFFF